MEGVDNLEQIRNVHADNSSLRNDGRGCDEETQSQYFFSDNDTNPLRSVESAENGFSIEISGYSPVPASVQVSVGGNGEESSEYSEGEDSQEYASANEEISAPDHSQLRAVTFFQGWWEEGVSLSGNTLPSNTNEESHTGPLHEDTYHSASRGSGEEASEYIGEDHQEYASADEEISAPDHLQSHAATFSSNISQGSHSVLLRSDAEIERQLSEDHLLAHRLQDSMIDFEMARQEQEHLDQISLQSEFDHQYALSLLEDTNHSASHIVDGRLTETNENLVEEGGSLSGSTLPSSTNEGSHTGTLDEDTYDGAARATQQQQDPQNPLPYQPGDLLDIVGGKYRGRTGTFLEKCDVKIWVNVDGVPRARCLALSSVRRRA